MRLLSDDGDDCITHEFSPLKIESTCRKPKSTNLERRLVSVIQHQFVIEVGQGANLLESCQDGKAAQIQCTELQQPSPCIFHTCPGPPCPDPTSHGMLIAAIGAEPAQSSYTYAGGCCLDQTNIGYIYLSELKQVDRVNKLTGHTQCELSANIIAIQTFYIQQQKLGISQSKVK